MRKLPNYFIALSTLLIIGTQNLMAQVGYYDAPYTRYEANVGTINNGTILPASFDQSLLQSEASEQICVNLFNNGSSVSWPVTAAGDGLVVRYSVPDNQSGTVQVYSNTTLLTTLTLSSYWSWEYLGGGANVNYNPKMRFDEVRAKLSSPIPAGGTLRLVVTSGNVTIDFAELEPVPAAIPAPAGSVTWTTGSLQTFIDNNPGRIIYVPQGVYNLGYRLWFSGANTTLQGAGMWYTQLNFTSTPIPGGGGGGLWAQANNISYADLYLTTDRNSRGGSYKAIHGAYTNGATIKNVWAIHFECGAWIANYETIGPGSTNGLVVSNCRFRNNYADGINLCRGTQNTIVEHCSFRNNGDDDMAIWSADNQECRNNTLRYNTSEHCWRSAGVAIYGGYNNKAQNILIQDNIEVGIKVSNLFGGVQFSTTDYQEFSNIIIRRCGTIDDLYNDELGAIYISSNNAGAGDRIRRVRFSCIDIINSKTNAVHMRRSGGYGFEDLIFQNIKIDGTGRATGGNRTGVYIEGGPQGSASYCGMTYANTANNVITNGYNFYAAGGSCPTGCSLAVNPASTTITSASYFGICDNLIVLTATATAAGGQTISKIEFFVDNVSIGVDNSSPYAVGWNSPTIGTHQVKAITTYSDNSTSTAIQTITVADVLYSTSTAPAILWAEFVPHALNVVSVGPGNITGPADLSANFKATRDATYLYIFVDVTDDALVSDGGNAYDNDQIELFIDMGNTKSTSYTGSQFSYNFLYNSSTVNATNSSPTTGIVATPGTKAGGYTMSIRIPWSTIGGAPANGTFIGLEVQVDDDDNGGLRDSKIAWTDASDVAYQNPSVFGTLSISNCTNPLPVEWLSFTVEKNNGTVDLNWSTAMEKNSREFIVERSGNSSVWQAIGSVPAAGNSSSLNQYHFTDNGLLSGISYYRLRQIDIDGKSMYSAVAVIQSNASEQTTVSIAPNPFTESLTIRSTEGSDATIRIIDLSGRMLLEETLSNSDGSITIQPVLPSGSYIMTVQSQLSVHQFKIIKRD